jgi:glucosyl-dolichyl phosphate glucuronosyltransferase
MTSLSAVICTHNRPAELADCLQALTHQRRLTQVVVVDSGPLESCEQLVSSFDGRLSGLVYLRVDEPGLSLARNTGVAAASGEVVAFLDDDAAARPGWDAALLAAFAEHPRAGCVGGACQAGFDGERPAWLSDRLLQLASITRWGTQARRPRSSAEWPFGANVAFRRSALDEVGPFSLALGRTGAASLMSGEDSDMVRRVLEAGWEVWLEPRAAVLHKVHAERLTSGFYWRRFWWGGRSRAQTPSLLISARLIVAVPARVAAWLVTRDRIFIYRLAETAGYFATLVLRAGARIRPNRGS